MDLNYLLYRQQVERSLAQSATCPEARAAHAELAALYQARIERATKGNLRFIPVAQRSWRSAAARSSTALMLKKGSAGSASHSTATYPTTAAKPLSDRLPVRR